MIARRIFPIILFALAACRLTTAEALPPTAAATSVQVIQNTLVPTADREFHAIENTAQSPPVEPTSCPATSSLRATRHQVSANVDYGLHTASVDQITRYANHSSDTLQQIIMDVEPNRWPGAFTLDAVTVDGSATTYDLNGRRLTIALPAPLESGCAVTLELTFRLTIPHVGQGLDGLSGYFGYTSRQLNLGDWLPGVTARLDGQWVIHDPIPIGEQTVLDPADWDVRVNVSDAPDGLTVVGPGSVIHLNGQDWHFTFHDARDFALTMSSAFNLSTHYTSTNVTVELYTLESADADSSQHALDMAVRAVEMYADLFGPYPHNRLVVVEGDFPDGMEFSGLVFVSDDWFRTYSGDPASYLTIITVHEVAHQWWYAKVGDDQAETPWMDEALATYTELIFIEENYPELKAWWWDFRVNQYVRSGYSGPKVDSTVYEFETVRPYINAVYLRGARMLDDLRHDLGTEAFFDWLRRYADAGADQIATPELFWSLLSSEQLTATQAIRSEFLNQPNFATSTHDIP